jgi:A/G-specific adenine glycosylase
MRMYPKAKNADLHAAAFRRQLLAWYDEHARDLPWRQPPGETKPCDPYAVWVSEIMLQQTRVRAVIAHYHEFLRRFPTVEKLAAARESSVLAAWSGLGYYRRARMLHAAAKVIVKRLDGKFPDRADGWRELPGIGRYTAAAVASIAFGQPVAVVDGNVARVLERVVGKRLSAAALWEGAGGLLDPKRPGDFNQAMMELGSTTCTPRAPACLMCPVMEFCTTRGEMRGLAKPAAQKKREIHYALDYRCQDHHDRSVLLVQRAHDARLMAGMWELPEIPAPNNGIKAAFAVRHSITTTDYAVQVWELSPQHDSKGEWIGEKQLRRIPLTGLARKILRKAGIISRLSGGS